MTENEKGPRGKEWGAGEGAPIHAQSREGPCEHRAGPPPSSCPPGRVVLKGGGSGGRWNSGVGRAFVGASGWVNESAGVEEGAKKPDVEEKKKGHLPCQGKTGSLV